MKSGTCTQRSQKRQRKEKEAEEEEYAARGRSKKKQPKGERTWPETNSEIQSLGLWIQRLIKLPRQQTESGRPVDLGLVKRNEGHFAAEAEAAT